MIARAALFGLSFFQRNVFAADADIKLHIITAGIRRRQLCGSDVEPGHTTFTPADAAVCHRLDSDRHRDIAVPGPGENLLRRTGLQYSSSAHDEHLVAKR